MIRWSFALLLAAGVLMSNALPTAAAGSGRLSGRVVDVRDAGRTIVVDEQGPWTGPNTGVVRHTIKLDQGTASFAVRPTNQPGSNRSPGYDITRINASDLKPGDFVNVLVASGVATALEVVRPDESALASPKTDSGK
jgi:hypothetical protein